MKVDIRSLNNQEEVKQYDFATQLYYDDQLILEYYQKYAVVNLMECVSEYAGTSLYDVSPQYCGYIPSKDFFIIGFHAIDEAGQSWGGYQSFCMGVHTGFDHYSAPAPTGFYHKSIRDLVHKKYPSLLDVILD